MKGLNLFSPVVIFFFFQLNILAESILSADTSAREESKYLSKKEIQKIHKFSDSPLIDGYLTDSIWSKTTQFKDFVQIQPGDNSKPTFTTTVFIGFNDKFLYIGINAEDEKNKIRATFTRRDNILDDDYIIIYLDTFNDQQRAYLLAFNPLGVQQDGFFIEGADPDYSPDIIMESHGILTSSGYTIEIAIPFNSLRYNEETEKIWGIHIFRKIKHLNNEENSWMPLKRGNAGLLNQAGKITGFDDIEPENNTEIIPTVIFSETGKRSTRQGESLVREKESFINEPVQGEAGITIKYAAASSTTFGLTINPDFAQVEADQLVITANQRFPVFFDEKRSFFLEGLDVFKTPLKPVHTRTMIDPDIALKYSHKTGNDAFAVLLASDNAPGAFTKEEIADPVIYHSIQKFIDKNAYIGMLRYSHETGQESYLGLLATSYTFLEKYNQLLGFDGRISLDEHNVLSFQILGTASKYKFYDPDSNKNIYRPGNGLGYYINLIRSGRYFNINLTGEGRSPDYRADAGFTTQVNTNIWSIVLRYNSEPQPDNLLISWSGIFTLLTQFDWQGRMKYSYYYPRVFLNFPKQSFFYLYLYSDYLRLLEEEFGPRRSSIQQGAFSGNSERSTVFNGFTIEAGSTPAKEFSFHFLLDRAWNAFDYDLGNGIRYPRVSPDALIDPNAPLNPGTGNALDLNITLKYFAGESFNISLDYIKSRLIRNDTKKVAFDQNIYLLGATFQFTRFAFIRLKSGYESISANINSQFLFGWTPNPGTALYVGYNTDLNYNGYNSITSKYEPGLYRNNQTFFLKLSYAFQFNF